MRPADPCAPAADFLTRSWRKKSWSRPLYVKNVIRNSKVSGVLANNPIYVSAVPLFSSCQIGGVINSMPVSSSTAMHFLKLSEYSSLRNGDGAWVPLCSLNPLHIFHFCFFDWYQKNGLKRRKRERIRFFQRWIPLVQNAVIWRQSMTAASMCGSVRSFSRERMMRTCASLSSFFTGRFQIETFKKTAKKGFRQYSSFLAPMVSDYYCTF